MNSLDIARDALKEGRDFLRASLMKSILNNELDSEEIKECERVILVMRDALYTLQSPPPDQL